MLNRKRCRIIMKYCFLCSFIIVLATGCGSGRKGDIISSELMQNEDSFGTDTVRYGDYVKTSTYVADLVYPLSTVITADYDKLIIDKISVEANTIVKKGDLLVSIQPVTDETIAEKEAAIAKNMDEFETGKNNYKKQIQDIQNSIQTNTGIDLQILQIQLKKLQSQYDWYVQDGNKVQEEMKVDLEDFKSIKGDVNIYAPYDGVIDHVESIPSGTELTTSRELLKMHSEEQVLLSVSGAGTIRYQMPVTIQAGNGENKTNYTGTVISADNVRTDALMDGTAYIKINEDVDASKLKNIVVTANEQELHNVLIVKDFAVSSEKDKKFVSVVDGDKVMKRHVVIGGSTGDVAWILQGVSEGQKVSIQ